MSLEIEHDGTVRKVSKTNVCNKILKWKYLKVFVINVILNF